MHVNMWVREMSEIWWSVPNLIEFDKCSMYSFLLTHWGQDKMGAISQTTFAFRIDFHWSLFTRVHLTRRHANIWTNAGLVQRHIYAALGGWTYLHVICYLLLFSNNLAYMITKYHLHRCCCYHCDNILIIIHPLLSIVIIIIIIITIVRSISSISSSNYYDKAHISTYIYQHHYFYYDKLLLPSLSLLYYH